MFHVLVDMTGRAYVLHQESSARLQRVRNASQHRAWRGLIVNRIEGSDQFISLGFSGSRHILRFKPHVTESFFARVAICITNGVARKIISCKVALRELLGHKHQRAPTSAAYVKNAYSLSEILDCIWNERKYRIQEAKDSRHIAFFSHYLVKSRIGRIRYATTILKRPHDLIFDRCENRYELRR